MKIEKNANAEHQKSNLPQVLVFLLPVLLVGCGGGAPTSETTSDSLPELAAALPEGTDVSQALASVGNPDSLAELEQSDIDQAIAELGGDVDISLEVVAAELAAVNVPESESESEIESGQSSTQETLTSLDPEHTAQGCLLPDVFAGS